MGDFERCAGSSPFCLGMVDFDCCGVKHKFDNQENADDDFQPPVKKGKLSLAKGKKKVLSPSERFNTTVTTNEIEQQSKGFVPKNTARSTDWAYRTFKEWLEHRNKLPNIDKIYPHDILEREYEADILCGCLQRFVSEARRSDGSSYPPRTLYQILCGLLRYSKSSQIDPPNFLDQKDARFRKLHNTCDVIFRSLHDEGIGADKKSAQAISKEHEDKLWESGVLNTTTPDGLQRAVFFYVGKICCLRGGEEQHTLKPSQFQRFTNPDRYIYTEHGSKNRNGGFYQLHVENKSVSIFKNDSAGERCLVTLLDSYLQKLPQAALKNDTFYCRSLVKYTNDNIWYSHQPRGKNYLANMVKNMFKDAKIDGEYTNHSLRASGASEMFVSHVPEKVIQGFTGHRSLKALRQYEKVSTVQKQAANNILMGTSKDFMKEVDKLQDTEVEKVQDTCTAVEKIQETKIEKPHSSSQHVTSSATSTNPFSFQMPTFSPVINSNSQGIINFTINICPSGSMAIGNKKEAIDDLLDGIDIKDIFD